MAEWPTNSRWFICCWLLVGGAQLSRWVSRTPHQWLSRTTNGPAPHNRCLATGHRLSAHTIMAALCSKKSHLDGPCHTGQGRAQSNCNRAGCARPLAGSHCWASSLRILLLGNRSCSAIAGASVGPAHKPPTVSEPPLFGLLSYWLPATGNCRQGTTGEVIQSRVSGVVVITWRVS